MAHAVHDEFMKRKNHSNNAEKLVFDIKSTKTVEKVNDCVEKFDTLNKCFIPLISHRYEWFRFHMEMAIGE
ncbi:hypothetical protein MBAV_004867 [Candidatus Magnetobacterium bavaricum]|uniref:Uncharacterized protein n=1 Tax=Candidatus Magnetobacterium bavaricum TaxID=29290 RepID=A0A0F3GQK4_9BACT|nr:hypothetical protein MBAV_004867 [Candidatus Magnetobacterium bavaricum]